MATGNNSKRPPSPNSQTSHCFVDESFKNEDASGYHLAIEVEPSGLSFTVLDKARNKYISLSVEKISDTDLEKAVGAADLLKLDYASTGITIASALATLVPAPLFDANKKDLYLKFNHVTGDQLVIEVDDLPTVNAHTVYGIAQQKQEFLRSAFKNVQIRHHSTVLIESLTTNYKNSDEKQIFVNARNGELDVIVIQGKQLIFCNSFIYNTKEDFMYYVLFVTEQLGLNPEHVELALCGDISKTDERYDMVLKYIRNVRFEDRPLSMSYSYLFDDIPTHLHYTLLNQYLCA